MDTIRPAYFTLSVPDPAASANAAPGNAPIVRRLRFEIDEVFWVGRLQICNLMITGDDQTSRFHATVQRLGTSYRVTDMNSRNGTMVNQRRIRSKDLEPGDLVVVGQSLFEFQSPRPSDSVFHDGESRTAGLVSHHLRRFPTSIPPPISVEDESKSVSMVHFLTVVVDRIAAVFQVDLVAAHVPGGIPAEDVTLVRGWRDNSLVVLGLSTEEVARISNHAPSRKSNPPSSIAEHHRLDLTRHSGGWEVSIGAWVHVRHRTDGNPAGMDPEGASVASTIGGLKQ